MVDATSFRFRHLHPFLVPALLGAATLLGCATSKPPTAESDADQCTPPPFVIVTESRTFGVCIQGDFAKITNAKGELIYETRPNAIAAMDGDLIAAMTLQYDLCKAIARGDVKKGDLVAYDKYVDLQSKQFKAARKEQTNTDRSPNQPPPATSLPFCQNP